MKKFLLLAAAALLISALPFAHAAPIPGDLTVIDDEEIYGLVTEALPLKDGMLVVGASEYEDNGWMASLRPDGKARWVLSEEGGGVFRCAGMTGDGGFSALIKRRETHDYSGKQTGVDETLLAFISSDGKITKTQSLAPYTEWMISHEDGFYLIGNAYGEPDSPQGEKPFQAAITHLDSAGETLWSLVYTNPAYTDMTFHKGVMAGDSLIVTGGGLTEDETRVGLIHRIGLDGRVLWDTYAQSLQQTFINDVRVTNGGLITGCYTGISFEEEMGFPEGRSGFVFCLTLDGEVVWEHSLKDSLSADYLLPMAKGFLVGSRGLDPENCPNLGDGWLLLLDDSGNEVKPSVLPDIGGGRLELMGMAEAKDSGVLLYGAALEEPGFLGAPFVTRLNIP